MERRCLEILRAAIDRGDGRSRWSDPVVAIAAADDSLFPELRRAVGPRHLLPREVVPEARSVVAFFLPFAATVVEGNVAGSEASVAWGAAYVAANEVIASMGEALAAWFAAQGFRSTTFPATHDFDPTMLTSVWSHKHIAFIAGLGRFGLHEQIITEAGCAGRLGSLITEAALPPTPRRSEEPCLAKRGLRCEACLARCPVRALTPGGFDRQRCYEVCLRNAHRIGGPSIADVCGKCACGVPCSSRSPGARAACE